MQFWGYKRKEGRAGIRNHVLILPTCACGSESCRIVASQVRGAVNIVFNTGCSDVAANTAMSQKVLTGFACNPNVYGVVIIGLGCETVPHAKLREKIQAMTSKPVVSFGIQEEGGTLKTIEKAVRAASKMAAEAAMQPKELCDISELMLGIECGGSDATSGIASNPAVGELSDLLVDLGATTMMSESIEWIGGEHLLAKRAATPAHPQPDHSGLQGLRSPSEIRWSGLPRRSAHPRQQGRRPVHSGREEPWLHPQGRHPSHR